MNYETPLDARGTETLASAETAIELDNAESPRRKRWLWVVLALLGAGMVAAYFLAGGGEGGAAAGAGQDDQAPTVTVIAPGRTTVEGQIQATGTLSARREIPVGVVGEGGRVVRVFAEAGDWVRQGQVLVAIDRSVQSQQALAQAGQIEAAQADAELAQANLDRALQLVERGFISQADIDRLTATRDAAVARVKIAQAQLSELRARNARLNIYAPASGLVLERSVEPGQTVSAGSPALFTLARGGEMELMAQLNEVDLSRISTGVSAEVTPTGTDKRFTGQVWQIAPTIDERSRQGIARVALPYARELRPGGFATAVIKSGTVVAPILPESAIQSDDEGTYVYIIDEENKARRRGVTTGMVTASGTTITDGLTGTEKVVLRAAGFLTEGETVNPTMQEE